MGIRDFLEWKEENPEEAMEWANWAIIYEKANNLVDNALENKRKKR